MPLARTAGAPECDQRLLLPMDRLLLRLRELLSWHQPRLCESRRQGVVPAASSAGLVIQRGWWFAITVGASNRGAVHSDLALGRCPLLRKVVGVGLVSFDMLGRGRV